MVILFVSGGTAGFIVGWIGAGSTIFINILSVVFLSRSGIQQIIDRIEYIKFRYHALKLLNDPEVQKILSHRTVREQIESPEPEVVLNWEKNPALKEAAERLGIFEEQPNVEPVTFEQDQTLEKVIEGLDVFEEKPKPPTGPIKSTTNYMTNRRLERLRKAAKKVVEIEEDSDILDIDFGNKNQPIRIPIRIRE
jgi:hypothetical protein